MNEIQLPDPELDAPPMPEETPEKRASLGGRILAYSFLASVVINLGWLGWVSSSNLFGGKAPLDLHPEKIKMVKIAQKPKPKPPEKKPPPPPPPPKQPPPKPLKTPPKVQPKIRPRPTPPRPRPAAPTHQLNVVHSKRSVSNAPALPSSDYTPTGPVNPGVETHAPETKPIPTPDPTPTPVPDPTPAPVHHDPPAVKRDPPPPPPVVVKPRGWVPIDSREASDVQSVDVSADGIDAGSINSNEVVISYTIDESGHIKGARVKKSCGSSELDNRVLSAVQRQRCAPAIQDHIPREAREEFHFPVNS